MYCDAHKGAGAMEDARKADAKAARKPYAEAVRSNDPLYQTGRWKRISREIRALHPFCASCGSTEGLQVHHVNPPKGDEAMFFDMDNLVVVCKRCHDVITAKEVIR